MPVNLEYLYELNGTALTRTALGSHAWRNPADRLASGWKQSDVCCRETGTIRPSTACLIECLLRYNFATWLAFDECSLVPLCMASGVLTLIVR
ncbi:MAG: hypothetical protein ACJAW7_003253 [Candidatus Azotimanducaceae bacterium]|jgi:hypothetical protein